MTVAARIRDVLGSTPVLRVVFAVLRCTLPVLRWGNTVIVTADAPVRAVLGDPAFGVAPIYAAKMHETTGDFILGMDDPERYGRERAFLDACVRPGDPARIAALVGAATERLLARAHGRCDLVQDLARLVPGELISGYFGVACDDGPAFRGWLRAIFWHLFLNLGDDPALRDQAIAASRLLGAHLDGLIADRLRTLAAGGTLATDTVLDRMASAAHATGAPDAELIRRNLGGLIVGAAETTAKAVVHATVELLRRPEALAVVRGAAISGDQAVVLQHVLESLRFRPHNPLIPRRALRDTTIAWNGRSKAVRAGATVYACTLGAHFDGRAFAAPGRFDAHRPLAAYLHFGAGRHTCFGERFNLIVLPIVVGHLMRLRGLRAAPGGAGQLRYEGPFPDSLMVLWDGPSEAVTPHGTPRLEPRHGTSAGPDARAEAQRR